jgi:PAS domain S-box-containing protein
VETEEKLKKSEINFRTTLDNMMEGVQVIDFNWRYIYVNEALTRYSRYNTKELLGNTIMELYPGVENTDLYKSLSACLNERKPQRLETEFVFPDGSKSDFELSMRPVPEGIFILSIDITEKKKAEQELKRTNERFELVVAATNDVIWDWNMIADTFWRNKNYYSHFGYDEQSIASDTSAWHNGIHPDDKERVLAGINQCITNKHHFWSDEYRYLKADQTVASVLDCGYILYSNDDQAYRMVGAMLDITARKKAEQDLKKSFEEKEALSERLSIILNTLPATIALLDSKGFIIEVNDAWRNFADANGLTGSAYCIGHNYIEISKNATGNDKKDGKKVAKGITAVLNKEAKEFVFEYPCHSLHEERWFRMVVTPLHHKTYGGVVVMHTDISELRRLEQERLKSKTEEQRKITKAMLQGQEKERNAIGAELHDNVNQILVATKLFLSVGKTDPQKSKEVIGAAISNIQNAIDENRKIAHELVGPDMEAAYFSEELLNLTTKMLGISGIEVSIAADNFREELLDNQRKLAAYRILQEQCTNIVKYAAATKVNVGLDTSDQFFTMRIADDGKGMESGKISNGIGLKNIKGRLSVFNGTATITTSPGNGFVLETQIPLE